MVPEYELIGVGAAERDGHGVPLFVGPAARLAISAVLYSAGQGVLGLASPEGGDPRAGRSLLARSRRRGTFPLAPAAPRVPWGTPGPAPPICFWKYGSQFVAFLPSRPPTLSGPQPLSRCSRSRARGSTAQAEEALRPVCRS